MTRVGLALFAILAFVSSSLSSVAAQPEVDMAFSDTLIRELGYPEVSIHVTPDGVEAPATLEAGYYVFTLSTVEDYVAYVDIMLPPAGLDEATMTELALLAGSQDLVQPDWEYLGGTNSPNPGETATFALYLAEGEFQVAASYYGIDGSAEEIMFLSPLTVTAPANPAASPVATEAPPAAVMLEMTDDLEYIVNPDPVPAGPQIWEFTNTGTQLAHHVVMVRVPDGTTADDIINEFTAMMSGTPVAEPGISSQMAWVGYTALISGGYTVWSEFDLDAGTYAVLCYIIDPETQRPHLFDGMVTTFTVA